MTLEETARNDVSDVGRERGVDRAYKLLHLCADLVETSQKIEHWDGGDGRNGNKQ
jgi:hypothetical protein